MKCSEQWLREWVNPQISREKLCDEMTMAGLEIESCEPAAAEFSNVKIGQVLTVVKHPEADRLHVCEVDIGESKPLNIVCGAQNVRAEMKVPVAIIGAVLPTITIKAAKLRGVPSEGMLCSAVELGLAEESNGLFEFPADAPVGEDVRNYLKLNDYIIEVSITPNRGDCLSVKGLAREVGAITKTNTIAPAIQSMPASIKDTLSVRIDAAEGCPRYVGRVIRNVKADLTSPIWLKERLRRSGIRSISPVVDVTNYVMLELGQPMHAFDLNKIQKEIIVRQSKSGERIALLDGSEKELDANTLVIADAEKPLAIAGVMGGVDSSVTALTKDIFLESAFFSPKIIARQRQYYNLTSDSAYRFERGVDYTLQKDAIERATQLILEIVGGEAGPLVEKVEEKYLPHKEAISFNANNIQQLLGIEIPKQEVEAILSSLGFDWKQDQSNGWLVEVPSYRFDIAIPQDLVEEVARLYGYDNIPSRPMQATLQNPHHSSSHDWYGLRQILKDEGFHEIVSYSFIDEKIQSIFDPQEKPYSVLNPITADMVKMRTSMWPGLITTMQYNKSRQQHRIRLFEIGTVFFQRGEMIDEQPRLAGLITGIAFPDQWGISSRQADFYDLKGNLENILGSFLPMHEITFNAGNHVALHPGKTADIYFQDKKIGIVGALHPVASQALDLQESVYLFDIDLNVLKTTHKKQFKDISKFPEIRRDIAILVNETVRSKEIQDTIRLSAGDWLKDVFIFDVYQGKGISPGLKSIALGLILQHPSRTLIDEEVADLMERVMGSLKGQFGAELRS